MIFTSGFIIDINSCALYMLHIHHNDKSHNNDPLLFLMMASLFHILRILDIIVVTFCVFFHNYYNKLMAFASPPN